MARAAGRVGHGRWHKRKEQGLGLALLCAPGAHSIDRVGTDINRAILFVQDPTPTLDLKVLFSLDLSHVPFF